MKTNNSICCIPQNDFYLFNTKTNTWLQICDDTSQVCGPRLMFDHQMCIDLEKNTIYVFGGRILTPRNIDVLSTDMLYSGLYSYHIGTNTWTEVLVDCGHPSAANPDVQSIKARVTHSMLFHQVNTQTFLFVALHFHLSGVCYHQTEEPKAVHLRGTAQQGVHDRFHHDRR